jgi:uncharacterized protein (DUF1697 family)
VTAYVALLRGVNVGGKSKLEMPRLKKAFEELGCSDVSTYINSGNVLFRDRRRAATLTKAAEEALGVRVAIRDLAQLQALLATIPGDWVNDKEQKTDVAFLLDEPGEHVWHVLRKDVKPGQQMPLDAAATARNVNTVRKLAQLLAAM